MLEAVGFPGFFEGRAERAVEGGLPAGIGADDGERGEGAGEVGSGG